EVGVAAELDALQLLDPERGELVVEVAEGRGVLAVPGVVDAAGVVVVEDDLVVADVPPLEPERLGLVGVRAEVDAGAIARILVDRLEFTGVVRAVVELNADDGIDAEAAGVWGWTDLTVRED